MSNSTNRYTSSRGEWGNRDEQECKEWEEEAEKTNLFYRVCWLNEMLGLEPSSIEWLLRKGTLPRRKIAGKIRFTLEDLQGLIDASAVTQCCATEQKGAKL